MYDTKFGHHVLKSKNDTPPCICDPSEQAGREEDAARAADMVESLKLKQVEDAANAARVEDARRHGRVREGQLKAEQALLDAKLQRAERARQEAESGRATAECERDAAFARALREKQDALDAAAAPQPEPEPQGGQHTVAWECKTDRGWKPYDKYISKTIEAGYARDRYGVVHFMRGHISYDCEFRTMQQVRTDGVSAVRRSVRRKESGDREAGGYTEHLWHELAGSIQTEAEA